MKNLGWHFFLALLIADILALLMIKLMVPLKSVLIVCGIVFVLLALVFFFGHNAQQRNRKREEQAAAKIADLQDQVEEALNSKKNKEEVSVH